MSTTDMSPPVSSPYDKEIQAILSTLMRRKLLVLCISSAITLVVGTATLFLPNTYTSSAILMPIEKQTSVGLSSLLGSMEGLGNFASQAGIGGGGAEKLVTIVNSRTLAEQVITKQHLLPKLIENTSTLAGMGSAESMHKGVTALKKMTTFTHDKRSNTVSIIVKAKDPKLAALIANTYSNELGEYLKQNALSTAKKNRIFIEEQLKDIKIELANHEVALKNFQQNNKIISIDAQMQSSLRSHADLKSRLAISEVELQLIKNSSFEGDPKVILKQQEIEEIKKQLEKFEHSSENDTILTLSKAPSLGLNYARLKRELLMREKVFELLTQQFEMARIQEAQEDVSFQVLDPAIPPLEKSGPRRSLIVIIAAVFAVVLGALSALLVDYLYARRPMEAL